MTSALHVSRRWQSHKVTSTSDRTRICIASAISLSRRKTESEVVHLARRAQGRHPSDGAKRCDSQLQQETPPKDKLAKDLKFDTKTRQITNNARANELLEGNPPRKGGKSITSSRSVNRDTRAHMTTE